MPSREAVIQYIDVAFSMAGVPEDSYGFKSLVRELFLCANIEPEVFFNATYAEKVTLVNNGVKEATDNLDKWMEALEEELRDYYLDLLIKIWKAYTIVESKSAPDKDNIIASYSFYEEHFTDKMSVDSNPDIDKVFEPFVKHLNKQRANLEKSTKDSQKQDTKSAIVVKFTDMLTDKQKVYVVKLKWTYC